MLKNISFIKMVHVILDQPSYMGTFTQIQKG